MGENTNDQHLMLLGEIKGIVEGLRAQQADQVSALRDLRTDVNRRLDDVHKKVDGMDGRLRVVEQRSAVVGAVSGGAMAIGVALIVESIKSWIGKGAPPGP